MDRDHLYKFSIPLQQKVPHEVEENWPRVSEEKSLKGVDGRTTTDGKWSQ